MFEVTVYSAIPYSTAGQLSFQCSEKFGNLDLAKTYQDQVIANLGLVHVELDLYERKGRSYLVYIKPV